MGLHLRRIEIVDGNDASSECFSLAQQLALTLSQDPLGDRVSDLVHAMMAAHGPSSNCAFKLLLRLLRRDHFFERDF